MARREADDEEERPEGHDVVLSKGPCPKCGSADNNVTYADGHEHCYTPGCGHYAPPSEGGTPKSSSPKPAFGGVRGKLLEPDAHSWPAVGMQSRGLTAETLKKFGVFRHGFNGKKVQVYPYYNMEGDLAGQKLRFIEKKDFTFLKGEDCPGVGECQLFGRQVFGDRYDRQVIVTEGELDALSVAQATNFKVAVVSVNAGADNAAKNLKKNYLWLDRFKEIILWFDDDEAGKVATEECAKLFKVGKVRIAKAPGFKDASDVLKANRPGDIQTAIYAAQAWRPRGIINAAANPADVLAPRDGVAAYTYPATMPKLNEMLGGIVLGEVIYHVAGTGVGKSTALREIQYHLLEQGVKIAVLSFEDTVRDAKMGLMSIAASERLHLREIPDLSDEKGLAAYDKLMTKWHTEVFSGGLVELFDPETAEWAMDAILGYVRYCAKALDCQVIFIDPISFVAAGLDLSADERRVLDKVAGEFAKLAKELNVNLQISHHLKRTSGVPHEEGAPTSLNELRSSGGLANFAMCVVGWERNNQAADEDWRITQSRVLKPARRVGKSGLADVLYYEPNGRLVATTKQFPAVGKPDGAPKERGGFTPVDGGDY